MRTRIGLCVAFGVLATAVAASDPPAKPATVLPPPRVEDGGNSAKGATPAQVEALKTEIEALIRERESTVKTTVEEPNSLPERMKLKSKVLALIDKIEVKNAAPIPMPPAKSVEATPRTFPKFDISPGTTDRDKLRSAENLFRTGDIDATYRILNLIDSASFPREERIFTEYLKACCLRRLGKYSEAKVLYRKIADEKEDEFFTESSITHLQIMNDVEGLEEGLKQLRAGRKKQ